MKIADSLLNSNSTRDVVLSGELRPPRDGISIVDQLIISGSPRDTSDKEIAGGDDTQAMH